MKNYITALGMAFAITLPHAALAQTVTPPAVPPGLEVPEGNHAFLIGHGVGTQNYVCAPTDKLGHVAFTLVHSASDIVQRRPAATHHSLLQPEP